jgi:hypothetical protein
MRAWASRKENLKSKSTGLAQSLRVLPRSLTQGPYSRVFKLAQSWPKVWVNPVNFTLRSFAAK